MLGPVVSLTLNIAIVAKEEAAKEDHSRTRE